jgi:Putative zinc-finger
MTEQHPADRPGHLDIDAVSAFIDRDLGPDDLATIEFHLHECPPCYREVLEIRTTVVLLTGLPQYTPRRSFCLGHEHARAGRHRRRAPRGLSWVGPFAPSAYPASATASVTHGESGRAAGWLPGLQAAAMVVGALLLLVTTSDLIGMPPQPAAWLSESEVPIQQTENLSARPPEAPPAPAPAMEPGTDSNRDSETASESDPAATNPESSFTLVGNESAGTTSGNSASEEVLEDAETADTAPSAATNAALAAVTSAVPTPASGLARSPEAATDGADAPAATDAQPSRLRLAQLVLAFALAWLVVSIVGLRWVRGLQRARD